MKAKFTHRSMASLLLCAALFSAALQAQTAAERAAAAGELAVYKNHRVLRLYGEQARERGFAHGYLLADKIIESMDDALKSLPFFTAEKFEKRLSPWAKQNFSWDEDAKQELEGLFDGLSARLNEKERVCPVLARAVTLDDLYAINVIADYFGPACSGFSAWGPLTEDGKVVYGRNLDFPIGGRAVSNQVLLAVDRLPGHDGRKKSKAWIGAGWPGLITVFTAMNEDGLVCCLHDATNTIKDGVKDGFVARGVLLRRILESIDPAKAEPAEAAARHVAERPSACGNLFHLAWPKSVAEKHKQTPAAVLEFDSASRKPGTLDGIAIRRMDAGSSLVLSNHFCSRNKEVECARFTRIVQAVAGSTKQDQKIDVAAARRILIGGELPTAAHTVVFLPDDKVMHVAITRGNFLSTRVAGTGFEFKDLLKRGKSDASK